MKFNSLRVKVIGVVLICLVAAAGIILSVFRASFTRETEQITRDAVAEARQSFGNLEKADINKMSAVLEALLANDAFSAKYTDAHREAMRAQAEPMFDRMKKEYHFTLWQFNNPASVGTVFLRMHNPAQFGDPVKRWMYDECVRTGSLVAGKELGHSGFALRVMMPQKDREGNILGYVEVGEQIGSFFESMKTQTGNQYGLALNKSLLQHDKWSDFRKSLGKKDNWDDLSSIVVADRTTEDPRLMNVQVDIDRIPDQGEVLGNVASGGATYVRGVFPLVSADGKRSGAVFVAKDMTAAFARIGDVQKEIGAVIVGVMVIISFIIAFMLRSWVFKRLDNMIEVATRVVGGDYECEIRKSANDEVGEFESLFDQFRKVFLHLVKSQAS